LPPSAQAPLPTVLQITGSRVGKPEIVTSYETGVRTGLFEGVRLDSTAFFADYSRLETYDAGTPQLSSFQGSPVILQTFDNGATGKGYSFGVENLIELTPSTSSRIQLWHSFQVLNTRSVSGQPEIFLAAEENKIPTSQLGARGQFDLPGNFEFNPMVRFVDSLSAIDVRSYWQADLQLAYKAAKDLRFSLNLANSLRDQHLEYRPGYVTRPVSKIERSLFLNMSYLF